MHFIIRNCYGCDSGNEYRASGRDFSAVKNCEIPIRVFLASLFALGEKRLLVGVLEEFASNAERIRA
jgi:hypothetical protein